MSKSMEYYEGDEKSRSLKKLNEWAKKKQYSVVHPPLLNIPIHRVIVDELHMMLRITDILLNNLIDYCIQLDQNEKFLKKNSTARFLDALVSVVRSCGISFAVTEVKNADKSSSGIYESTSLMGDDKKKIMAKLPQSFRTFIPDQKIALELQNLWQDFYHIYLALNSVMTPTASKDFFKQTQQWITLFLSFSGKLPGFEHRRITPYMHVLVYHAPNQIGRLSSIKPFTAQHVEKTNDIIRSVHQRKSNKHDGCFEAMAACKRMEELRPLRREKRKYPTGVAKNGSKYMKTHGINPREDTLAEEAAVAALENLSSDELKAKLKSLGIKTRARKPEVLIQLIRQAIDI